MRIAFVTPEFPTVIADAGGLSTYLGRMSRLLAEAGHEVEVFVGTGDRRDVATWHGATVRHVQLSQRWARSLPKRLLTGVGLAHRAERRDFQAAAREMAAAFEVHHRQAPYELVQSADFLGMGSGIKRLANRLHVVRCSSAIDLYMSCDGRNSARDMAQVEFEQAAIGSADLAYAPSRLIAEHLSRQTGRRVDVLRPPASLEAEAAELVRPAWLPARYLVHFAGNLIHRKGTPVVAEALSKALQAAPDLTMIWVGRIGAAALRAMLHPLGPFARNVIALHRLDKRLLYPIISNAVAAVLPSLVDNLPNTVIEALLLGVPVIGTRATSIEELVAERIDGILVEPGRSDQLADAMVSMWRGEFRLPQDVAWLDRAENQPFRAEEAVRNFIAYATACQAQR